MLTYVATCRLVWSSSACCARLRRMATKPTPPCTPAAISLRPMSAPIEKLVLAGTGSIRIDHDTGNIHYRPAQYRLERLLNGDVVVLPVR